MYYPARMVDADEDPKFIARRTVIFASELKVPSGRGHAARTRLVNLKKLAVACGDAECGGGMAPFSCWA
jgi:replication-associated recombination protein RarA